VCLLARFIGLRLLLHCERAFLTVYYVFVCVENGVLFVAFVAVIFVKIT
jgi:hypothetical protein